MNHKQQLYNAYQQLTPLEAYNLAHELARHIDLYILEHDGGGVDPAVIAYSLNRTFEMIGVELYLEEEDAEHDTSITESQLVDSTASNAA